MTAADRIIRWSTALAVLCVAAVAAVVSYEHACDLVRQHGESGETGRLIPLTVDGLIYASSMVMLDSARRGVRVPGLARWLLGVGIVATLAANVAHGWGHGLIGAAVAAWPAVALVGSYELLMMIIRGTQMQAVTTSPHGDGFLADPLGERAVVVFAADLAADRVPSVRAIRVALHVGQPRAQRLRGYLAAVAESQGEDLAALRRETVPASNRTPLSNVQPGGHEQHSLGAVYVSRSASARSSSMPAVSADASISARVDGDTVPSFS